MPAQPVDHFEQQRGRGRSRGGDHRRGGVVGQLAGAHRRLDPLVALQQPERHPAGVGQPGEHRLHPRHHLAEGRFHFGRIGRQTERGCGALPVRHGQHRIEQRRDALTLAGGGGDHRDTQLLLQLLGVDRDAVAPSLIHQVEADHHPTGDLQDLQRQRKIALQPSRVEHHHGHIGLAEENEVAGDFLVGAAGLQRVGPRQVDDLDPLATVLKDTFGPGDRLAGPVAGVLPQAGERVEDGALAGVGIAGEGDQEIMTTGADPELNQFGSLTAVFGWSGCDRGHGQLGAGAGTRST